MVLINLKLLLMKIQVYFQSLFYSIWLIEFWLTTYRSSTVTSHPSTTHQPSISDHRSYSERILAYSKQPLHADLQSLLLCIDSEKFRSLKGYFNLPFFIILNSIHIIQMIHFKFCWVYYQFGSMVCFISNVWLIDCLIDWLID
jgi:hypothetical protein